MSKDPRASTSRSVKQNSSRRQYQPHLQQLPPNVECDEEVSEEIVSLPYRRAYEMAAKFAATSIGQFVITRGERMLGTVETTAKWSLPKAQFDDKLKRPLPWIPFLMLIITLRLARVWLSIAALMIGNAPVKANDVVYFIQTRRRKLRSLRSNGAKEIKSSPSRTSYLKDAIKAHLQHIFNKAICRPGQRNSQNEEASIVIVTRNEGPVNVSGDHQVAKRIRCDEESDPDITLEQKLDKYSGQNSDDDPDYVPDQNELLTNETSATSTACTESAEEGEAVFSEQASDATSSPPEENSQLNQSVEMIDNGHKSETLPKPMVEIKKEVNSDTESNEAKAGENGGENRAADVALRTQAHGATGKHSNETEAEKRRKSTAGHSSGDREQQQTKSALNVTAAAANSTPTYESDEKRFDDISASRLASISSSEDDFYSPIGSPPDFNAFQQQLQPQLEPQSLDLNTMAAHQNPFHAPKVLVKDSHYPNPSTGHSKRHHHNRGHAQGQGNNNQNQSHGLGNNHNQGQHQGRGKGQGKGGQQQQNSAKERSRRRYSQSEQ